MSWVPPDGAPGAPPTAPPGADHQPAPPPPEPARPGRRAVAVVAVLALLVGSAAALLAFGRSDDGDERRASPTTTAPADSAPDDDPPALDEPPAAPTELQAAVDELSAYVADVRQLPFLRPVEVELLDGDAFVDRLFRDAEEDRDDVEESDRVLTALGLIPTDVDLFETFTSYLGDAVLGFYDPETDELVVRGAALTPYIRSTLVHELVHALDDQHFELHRPELDDADDERGIGFQAVVEGNAVRIEQRWTDGLGADERRQLEAERIEFGSRIDYGRVPPVVVQLIAFPYLAGPDLVKTLLDHGGEEAVNEALRDPPTTTEQVLDPAAYLTRHGAAEVAPPPADGEVFDQGAYGQFALLLTLSDVVDGRTAQQAVEGWAGDWYVAWPDGDATCVRARFVMDSPGDGDALGDALRDWADEHGDADVETDGAEVRLTACR